MCWAGWVFDFYDLILFTFLLMPIAQEYHFTNLQMSYVLGASLAATAVGGVIFGIMSDRFGRKPVLQWTIMTYSLGAFFIGTGRYFLAPDDLQDPHRFGCWRRMGNRTNIYRGNISGKGQGEILCLDADRSAPGNCPCLDGWAAWDHAGYRMEGMFFISVLPALMVLYIRRRIPESDLWSRRKEAEQSSQKTILHHGFENLRQFLMLFSAENRRYFLFGLVLSTFDMTAYWLTYSWMPGYLHTERNFTLTKSAFWILVTQAGGFLGYLFFGFLADRFGRRPAYSLYSVIMALGLVMVALLLEPDCDVSSDHLGIMFMACFRQECSVASAPCSIKLYRLPSATPWVLHLILHGVCSS